MKKQREEKIIHTAAYKLFHYNYPYVIRSIDHYSVEFIEKAGVVTTGDKKIDRALANENCYMMGPTIDMVDKFNKGININFTDLETPYKIFRIIEEHLVDWSDYIETQMFFRAIPYEDLKAMDSFASNLFYTIRARKPSLVINESIKKLQSFGFGIQKQKEKYPDYVSGMDSINDTLRRIDY